MKKLNSIILAGLLILLSSQEVAANATMGFTPSTASLEKPLNVELVIEGHGEKFNASEAQIEVPSNIKIDKLVLGNCNFSFLKTPSIQNPSFAGVLLSDYSTKCTVYKLVLVPTKRGEAVIKITDASVRRYGDAKEVLNAAKNSTYKITNVSTGSEVKGTNSSIPKDGFYSVVLNVFSTDNKPLHNADIILGSVSNKNLQKNKTDKRGIVQFTDIKSGIYTVTVQENNRKIGESIINVMGPNKILTLGINIDAQKNNPLLRNTTVNIFGLSPFHLGGILIGGILLGVGTSFLFIKLRRK